MKLIKQFAAPLLVQLHRALANWPMDGRVDWQGDDGSSGRHPFRGLSPAEIDAFVEQVLDRTPLDLRCPERRPIVRYRVTRTRVSPFRLAWNALRGVKLSAGGLFAPADGEIYYGGARVR